MSDCSDKTASLDNAAHAPIQQLDPTVQPTQDHAANRKKDNVSIRVRTGTQRGKNWSEEDFLLLLKAYAWIEENKKGVSILISG